MLPVMSYYIIPFTVSEFKVLFISVLWFESALKRLNVDFPVDAVIVYAAGVAKSSCVSVKPHM